MLPVGSIDKGRQLGELGYLLWIIEDRMDPLPTSKPGLADPNRPYTRSRPGSTTAAKGSH
jgi:hypothetical protein